MLSILFVILVLFAGVARLAQMALRAEHLVVLHWPKRGFVLLERTRDGRYGIVPLGFLPLSALRYGLWSTVAALGALRRRVGARVGALLAPTVGAKV